MALNDKLITITDVRKYRDVDTSFDQTRFDGFLKSIQDGELKELLGGALWLNFFKNITNSNYQTLLDGEEYEYQGDTVLYEGLKPYLVWAWLNVLPLDGNVHHTQSGDYAYLRGETTKPSKAEINQIKEDYKRNMIIEQNNIVQYLNTNKSDFPLWNDKNQVDEARMKIDFI